MSNQAQTRDTIQHSDAIVHSTERLFLGLKEGGLDLSDRFGLDLFAAGGSDERIELVRYERGRYLLVVALGGKLNEGGAPVYARISAELTLVNKDTGVVISRRTDRDLWEGEGINTFSLPTGHPLAELAHGVKFLDLGRERHPTPILNDHQLFLSLMEMGRVFKAGT